MWSSNLKTTLVCDERRESRGMRELRCDLYTLAASFTPCLLNIGTVVLIQCKAPPENIYTDTQIHAHLYINTYIRFIVIAVIH